MEEALDEIKEDDNYQRFLKMLEEEVKKAAKHDYTIGICMLSLDIVQTTSGYNRLFPELSWVIENEAKVVDLIVPYTYMDIALILRKTLPVDVELSAQRIRAAVEKHRFEIDGTEFRTTVSIGAACYPQDADSHESLAAKAKAAMEEAIARGKNQIAMAK